MLTALGSTDDTVKGLDTGADDYMVKPFNFKELLARIRALKRRGSGKPDGDTYKIADLVMNTDTRIVKRGGALIKLTVKEFSLLEVFLRNAGKVLSRSELAERVWDISFDPGTNVVDVYVNYLRKKIDHGHEKKLIQTVVGVGYVLREEE
jgi:DNA-binding response OmpR family regulator